MTTNNNEAAEVTASTQNKYTISKKDLPLHCPMDGMALWDSHPRVFLPMDANGKAKCPYCGADYEMVD